jgi:hypothetical protein
MAPHRFISTSFATTTSPPSEGQRETAGWALLGAARSQAGESVVRGRPCGRQPMEAGSRAEPTVRLPTHPRCKWLGSLVSGGHPVRQLCPHLNLAGGVRCHRNVVQEPGEFLPPAVALPMGKLLAVSIESLPCTALSVGA